MKNKISEFLIAVAIGMAIMFFIRKPQIKEVRVPFRVEVEVPVVEKQFDTVYEIKEVIKREEVVDKKLLEEYKKANDSLKTALFNSAITVRDYRQVFEDSTITITVNAKVTGTLKSLVAEYKTKPKIVVVDSELTVEVPDYSRAVSVYGELGMPAIQGSQVPPVLKIGFDISNKKDWIWGGSYDTEKRVWLKIGKKFNF